MLLQAYHCTTPKAHTLLKLVLKFGYSAEFFCELVILKSTKWINYKNIYSNLSKYKPSDNSYSDMKLKLLVLMLEAGIDYTFGLPILVLNSNKLQKTDAKIFLR
jgi:hypothetical protein